MKSVVMSIFLLSFFLSKAAAIKCFQCHERNSDTCKDTEIECPDGNKCITVSEEDYVGGNFHSIYKGCSGNIPCNRTEHGYVNPLVSFRLNTRCCEGELCNSGYYEMPSEEDGKPSGTVCPKCCVAGSLAECVTNKTMICQRKDDKCFKFIGEVLNAGDVRINYTLTGCMSPMACLLDLKSLIGARVIYQKLFECTDGQHLSST